MQEIVLKVERLGIFFDRYASTFHRGILQTVEDINLEIAAGTIVAVVGASGSGKSLLAHSLLGILPKNAQVIGKTEFLGQPLTEAKKRLYRGKEICLIPQSVSYLDPVLPIRKQLSTEKLSSEQLEKTVKSLGLDASVLDLYPFQLSGGMARRILFATALSTNPRLIVADEPTPGMDLKQAVKALSILKERVEQQNSAVLFITHDLDLALNFADKIIFFHQGKTIDSLLPKEFEKGPTATWHPFTIKMWHALPQHGFSA